MYSKIKNIVVFYQKSLLICFWLFRSSVIKQKRKRWKWLKSEKNTTINPNKNKRI